MWIIGVIVSGLVVGLVEWHLRKQILRTTERVTRETAREEMYRVLREISDATEKAARDKAR